MSLNNPSKYKKENKNLLKNVLSCLGLHDRPSHAIALQEDQKTRKRKELSSAPKRIQILNFKKKMKNKGITV